MSTRTTPIVANGMGQTRRRLERWRETRTAGMPMPEELWAAATKIARRHGVYPTARALGLEYNKLKRLAQPTGQSQKELPAPTFVELIAAQSAGGSECRIEMEGPRGGRVKIELPTASGFGKGTPARMNWWAIISVMRPVLIWWRTRRKKPPLKRLSRASPII